MSEAKSRTWAAEAITEATTAIRHAVRGLRADDAHDREMSLAEAKKALSMAHEAIIMAQTENRSA